MFCPRCGAQNELEQGYCRQCGQSLSDVRLALEGSAGQSLERLKASSKWIGIGGTTLIVQALIALSMTILGIVLVNPTLSYIAIVNLSIGLAVGLPLIYAGKSNLKRAARLLSKSQTESGHSVPEQTHRPNDLLTTDLNKLPVPGSVTENTTFDLQRSERGPNKAFPKR
jgi:hypothetical protein